MPGRQQTGTAGRIFATAPSLSLPLLFARVMHGEARGYQDHPRPRRELDPAVSP
jgi:hypothetical protein